MIKTFKDKNAKYIFEGYIVRDFGFEIQKSIRRKLLMLDSAPSLFTLLQTRSNRLEKLKGDRIGQHSIRANNQYRICFIWFDNDAYNVEVVDYH